jgi:SAM-dependent methyltransferase
VLDLGGRDVNGSIRSLFPDAVFTVLDIEPAPDVDIVADAGTWEPDKQYAYVLATELFEHTANWAAVCRTAYKALRPGGKFIVTTAGPGRPLHGASGAGFLVPYEYYANVPGYELERVLTETGFQGIVVDTQEMPPDTRAVAYK